ncbi:MAG: hypothetical protein HUJ26_01090 [Planctomycetaceae bacterium]|nr:hypothetical protein [Planctomycetaceae bacterium]
MAPGAIAGFAVLALKAKEIYAAEDSPELNDLMAKYQTALYYEDTYGYIPQEVMLDVWDSADKYLATYDISEAARYSLKSKFYLQVLGGKIK